MFYKGCAQRIKTSSTAFLWTNVDNFVNNVHLAHKYERKKLEKRKICTFSSVHYEKTAKQKSKA